MKAGEIRKERIVLLGLFKSARLAYRNGRFVAHKVASKLTVIVGLRMHETG